MSWVEVMVMIVAGASGPSPRSEGCPGRGECRFRHAATWGDGGDTRDRPTIE